MSLAAGTRLGPYEIQAAIGAGGMGEVYKARDTRLDRSVAIKVLPADLNADPERRARFEREARAVAALSHPHICTLHDIGTHDGTTYLVMEYLAGESLAERLLHGPLPLAQALDIAAQIAEALDAAHKHGIIHRDLKPGNVMLTSGGAGRSGVAAAKLLDFGLAKLAAHGERPALESQTHMPTQAAPVTAQGTILGTLQYMAPEQLEGKEADARTDLWALGAILYEMLTGRRAFEAESQASLIGKIMNTDPAALLIIQPLTPPALDRVVRKCLAKEPGARWQSASDLADELSWISIESGVTVPGARPVADSGVRRRTRYWVMAAASAVVAAALGVLWVWPYIAQLGPPALAPVSFETVKMTRLSSTGKATLAAISPDGKFVVHVVAEPSGPSLWVRQTMTASDIRIVPPAEVRYQGITVSPDGAYVCYVAYLRGSGIASLFQIPVLGGTARKILDDIDSPPSFSPDGSRFVFVRGIPDPPGSAVMIANADGTSERQLALRKPPLSFNQTPPAWSPDGKSVAVSGSTISGTLPQHVVLVNAETGAERTLGEAWLSVRALAWTADGSAVLASAVERGGLNRQIWRIACPGGTVTRITNDLANYDGVSLSADSRLLVTVQSETLSAIWIMPASDPSGARAVTSGPRRDDGRSGVAWTPDGRIVYESSTDGNPQIWVMDADGSNQKALTADNALNVYPAVCAGGRYVIYTSVREGAPQLWRMDIDGSNPMALAKEFPSFRPLCAPDATSVVYNAVDPAGRQGAWRVAVDGGAPEKIAEHQFMAWALSPDGMLAAGQGWDAERQRQSIGTLDLANPATLKILPIGPRPVSWMPAGRVLGYVEGKEGTDNVWIVPYAGGEAKRVTRFTDQFIFAFAWSQDGKRLALSRGTVSTDVVLLTAQK